MSGEKQNLTALWRAAINGDMVALIQLIHLRNVKYMVESDIRLVRVFPEEPVSSSRPYSETITVYTWNLKLILEATIYRGEVERVDLTIERLYCCD